MSVEELSDREVQVLSEMRRCRHFSGIQNDTCLAGVNYRNLVGGDDFGWALGIPCLGDYMKDRKRAKGVEREIVECDKRSTRTREEAEQEVDESNAHVAGVLRRIEAGEDVPGVIVCGLRTEPEGKECPQSVDGKCSKCGAPVEPIYGIGSGYGGIGGYSFCANEECGEVHDFVPDDGE